MSWVLYTLVSGRWEKEEGEYDSKVKCERAFHELARTYKEQGVSAPAHVSVKNE